MRNFDETIAAIATASGNGSISIIRVSGPDAVEIVDGCFFHGRSDLLNKPTHTIHYGWIGSSCDDLIDEVLVLLMRAPRSYTAEDVVEIHCHGGGLAAGAILKLLLEKGVRLAEPGEFTKRAFLNGRIDLTQAESVMEIIRSRSDLALSTAGKHLRGDIREIIRSMREIILTDMAYLEAALDDPEHIELDDFQSTLMNHLDPVRDEIDDLIQNSENGRLISEGVRTAIVGRPNVGKSSFLNCLLREDRAIVTDIPGTTRDTLEEDIRIGGVLLRLIDTAGIRDTDDPVEMIGVDRARSAMMEADLVICIIDSSEHLMDEDKQFILNTFLQNKSSDLISGKSDDIVDSSDRVLGGCTFVKYASEVDLSANGLARYRPKLRSSEEYGIGPVRCKSEKTISFRGDNDAYSFKNTVPSVIVLNKSDLNTVTDKDVIIKLFNGSEVPPIIEFSAKTGDGLKELESLLNDLLLEKLYGDSIDKSTEPVITSLRQREALMDASAAIVRIYETIDAGMPEDLLTVDLLSAYESLGRITGETVEDDLADKIFSDFCMGK